MSPLLRYTGALLLCFPLLLNAQTGVGDQRDVEPEELVNPQVPKWVLKTNPLRTLWGPIPFTSEYRLNVETVQARYQSSQVGISYLGKSPILTLLENSANPQGNNNFGSFEFQVVGGRLQFAHKFFLRGIFPWLEPGGTLSSYAPNGYYLAPYFSMAYADIKVNHSVNPLLKMTHLNANLILGRQMFFWEVIAFDVYGGVGVKKNKWVQGDPVNHNANIVNQTDMGLYGGDYRIMLGFDLGIHF